MCQPIRGHGGYLGFQIDIKVTTIGQDLMCQVLSRSLQPFLRISHLQEKVDR